MRTAPSRNGNSLAAQLGDALLGLEQQLGGEVAERHDHLRLDEARAAPRGTAGTSRSRAGAGRGCPAGGTSPRWRCRRRRASSPMPSIRLVSSWPARPTNGSPVRSSCSPGPSPTNIRSAWASPTPNTTCVRVAASGHFVQVSASRSRSANEANGGGSSSDTAGPDSSRRPGQELAWSDGLVRRPDQRAFRWYATASRTASAVTSVTIDAEPVEMGVDHAGRAREREVAVVAGVRRVDRPRQPVVRAPGEEVALDLGAPGVGDDHRERGVAATGVSLASGLARAASRTAPPRGTPGLRAAPRAHDRRAVGVDDVADRVHHDQRADHDVAVAAPTRARARRCRRARRRATCRRSRRGPRRPARRRAVAPGRMGRPGRRQRGTALVGAGRSSPGPTRSKIAAAGTIGTGPPRVGNPRPCSASARITPSAAARPNAEPPDSTIASTCSTRATGSSTAVSRVAGAPPRISTERDRVRAGTPPR